MISNFVLMVMMIEDLITICLFVYENCDIDHYICLHLIGTEREITLLNFAQE